MVEEVQYQYSVLPFTSHERDHKYVMLQDSVKSSDPKSSFAEAPHQAIRVKYLPYIRVLPHQMLYMHIGHLNTRKCVVGGEETRKFVERGEQVLRYLFLRRAQCKVSFEM